MANDNIYICLCFPLTIFFFLHIQGIIGVSSLIMTFFDFTNLSYAVYPTLTWFFIAYIIRMNVQIKQSFEHICAVLKEKYQFNSTIKSFKSQGRQPWYREKLPSKKTSAIHLYKIDLYKPCFELRLHRLIRLDMAILLSIFLFALNQIVFIYQTN